MIDFNDIRGQEVAKRALEIALVGHLSIYLHGPAGNGKTMLLEAARAIGGFDGHEGRCAAIGHAYDLHVEVQWTSPSDIILPPPTETSAAIADRVLAARALLLELMPDWLGAPLHEALKAAERLTDDNARRLMAQACTAMHLSPEGASRVWRAALVIAAMAGARFVGRIHVAEALSYARSYRSDPRRQPRTAARERLVRIAWAHRARARGKPVQVRPAAPSRDQQLIRARIASPIRPAMRLAPPVDGLALFDAFRSPAML